MKISIMKENQFSIVGKAITAVCGFVLAAAALANIWRGEAPHPELFVISIAGFIVFCAAKVSVLKQARWVSFGTKQMSPGMANAYRVGYWLMLVGLLATFV